MYDFFQHLQDTEWATAIAESALMFPALESVHVYAIALMVGSIAVVDLRLLGITWRQRPLAALMGEILPVTWGSFAIGLVTGGLLFASAAGKYYNNTPFRMKMLFMLLAGVNVLVFHFVIYHRMPGRGAGEPTPLSAKLVGALSLIFWVAVVVFGRWIGFMEGNI